MHSQRQRANEQLGRYAEEMAGLSRDIYGLAAPGYSAARDIILGQLQSGFGEVPPFVGEAFNRLAGATKENYALETEAGRKAIMQRLRQMGTLSQLSPGALGQIMGQYQLGMQSNLANALAQQRFQEANIGLQTTMDLLGKLMGLSTGGLQAATGMMGQAMGAMQAYAQNAPGSPLGNALAGALMGASAGAGLGQPWAPFAGAGLGFLGGLFSGF